MGVKLAVADESVEATTNLEEAFDTIVAWFPYVTLSVGLALEVLSAVRTPSRLPLTVGLAALALAWVYFLFTRPQGDSQTRLRIYVAGFTVLGAVMMVYRPGFFVFVITGFVHAFLLKPAPVAFFAVGLNSLVINSRMVFPEAGPDGWSTYLIIVVIQTAAIGFGITGGEKIAELSEQRRVSLADLRAAMEENAALHERLVDKAREAGVIEERQRMARELHDTIAQGLTGVITQLEAAGQVRGDGAERQRRIDSAMDLARNSLSETRRAMRDLLPAPLEERGLPAALEEVTTRWSTLSRVAAELVITGTAHRLHPEVEVTLLRVAQEALANVGKHARASRVAVTLSYMGDIVSLDVRDDGVGMPPSINEAGSGAGFGLTAMRQRVEALTGTLAIESEPEVGTAVSAFLPAVTVDVGSA